MFKENLSGLLFKEEAEKFQELPNPIIDVHTHISGREAAKVYAEVRGLFSVSLTYSMTQLEHVQEVKDVLGDSVRFIAIPKFQADDLYYEHTDGYKKRIDEFYAHGARMVKFWCAPYAKEMARSAGKDGFLDIDSKERQDVMQHASQLGCFLMAHIADPDTWFATKYQSRARFGSKDEHYAPLQEMLAKWSQPWLLAHMGGWPENLEFLDQLLETHDNVYLDTSATKWMIRELSKHSKNDINLFFEKWKGRILFGSDIVTIDDHLGAIEEGHSRAMQANSREQAFDLYASRYWSLRYLFEQEGEIPSTIADSDLMLLDSVQYNEFSAPMLKGKALAQEVLAYLYYRSANELLNKHYER